MNLNIEKIKNIFETEENITATAKRYAKEEGVEYTDSLRRRFSIIINKQGLKPDEDLDTVTKTNTNQYDNDNEKEDAFNMPSAWDSDLNRFLSIEEYCDKFGLDKDTVQSSKLVSHNAGHMIYNIAFKRTIATASGIDEDFIEEVVKKHIKLVDFTPIEKTESLYFDRLVITDVHIGMSTEGGRNVETLYNTPWNKKILFDRLDEVIDHVFTFKKGSTIVVDELGDFVDGLLGQTTRKGHELPQNMSDKECFDIAIEFKIKLVDKLLNIYSKVICNSIVEDNHAGFYGYFVSSAVKNILEEKYGSNHVEYNIFEKFINHYSIAKHTFVLTHGKDSEALKFGFKPQLDTKQSDKIDQYCKEYNLYNGNHIEFSKGDSHQFMLDYSTSNDFDYFNYPAFSPPSNWVKSNFGKSVEGCVFQNIDKQKNIKINIPLFF